MFLSNFVAEHSISVIFYRDLLDGDFGINILMKITTVLQAALDLY